VRAHAAGAYSFATAGGRKAAAELPAPPVALVPAGPWSLEFPDAAAPGEAVRLALDEPKSWTELTPDAVRYFAGTAHYRVELQVPAGHLAAGNVLTLDLGQVAEVAEVSVNGAPAVTLWHAPYCADVTGLLRPGRNVLEVAVTNLWHNRIVGDLRAPDAPPRTSTNLKQRFRADMPLLPSGLLGPVTVRAAVERDVPLR